MINAIGLRCLLTAMFALPTVYALWLTTTPGRALSDRVGHALHAVMGVAMVAMVWPWGMQLPVGPQVVVFAAGALWFAVAALVRSAGPGGRAARLLGAVPHIVMMAAMAWMAAVMDGSAMADGSGGADHDMPGMDMSGTGALSTMTLSRTADQWTAGLLAAGLVALGLYWLGQAFDRFRVTESASRGVTLAASVLRSEASEPACHAAMAVGMGLMFALLL
ncbi:DUF5134 domain-containing protein [Streptomyces sp. NPDC090023]|uniref:DUF5134 domain-containing protein n=1 Tax=unclassified Streptomyces TaxID=2593676 RepID=UPI00381B091D